MSWKTTVLEVSLNLKEVLSIRKMSYHCEQYQELVPPPPLGGEWYSLNLCVKVCRWDIDIESGLYWWKHQLGRWTKLFWIDVLWQKIKTSKAMQIILWLSLTVSNSTHGELFSCTSRKGDLRYSVSKFADWMTKGRKTTLFLRKK